MKTSRWVVLALAAATMAAGCGGGDDEATVTETVVETVSAPAETTATTPAETTETTEAAAAPAAAGGITPAGSTLKMGETATIAYDDSSSGKKTTIEVTPQGIEKGSIDDFKNIDLDADQKAATPFYVKVSVKNVGKGDLGDSEPGSYIDAVDDRGQEQNEIIFFGDFERCPSADVKSFKPGDSYETCLTYLVPGGGSIEGMRWIMFDEKSGKSNIDWK